MTNGSTPSSQTVWNAILTIVGGTLLATIGYLHNEITALKEQAASTSATRFTEEEALGLRSDITVLLTEIDKRMAIMENNSEWVKVWVMSGKMPNIDNEPAKKTSAKVAPPTPSISLPKVHTLPNITKQGPRKKPLYDLRQQRRRNDK